jgi:hypothetical protein
MEKEPEKALPQSAGLQALLKKSPGYAHRYAQLVQNVKNLSAGGLKGIYPGEYSSWSNRKHWANKHGKLWSVSMTAFPDFLMVTGPIPKEAWTLDRIDTKGHYLPENVRWASKQMQAQNRTTARLVTFDGATRTLTEVAQLTGIPYDTLRIGIDRRGNEYLAKVAEKFAEANSNSEESLWQFPAEYREMLELDYSVREDPDQNRMRFFLKLTRATYSELTYAGRHASDPTEKKQIEDEAAVVKGLHNKTVADLKAILDRREDRLVEARQHALYGHIKVPSMSESEQDEFELFGPKSWRDTI